MFAANAQAHKRQFAQAGEQSLDFPDLMQTVVFQAARDIQADEDLTFFYGSKLWFEDSETHPSDNGEGMSHDHMDHEAFLGGINL